MSNSESLTGLDDRLMTDLDEAEDQRALSDRGLSCTLSALLSLAHPIPTPTRTQQDELELCEACAAGTSTLLHSGRHVRRRLLCVLSQRRIWQGSKRVSFGCFTGQE